MAKLIKKCRSCGNKDLKDILDLGDLAISDFKVRKNTLDKKYPLSLVYCPINNSGCGLVQLKHTYNPTRLFREYWYLTGINQSMVDEINDITNSIKKLNKPIRFLSGRSHWHWR